MGAKRIKGRGGRLIDREAVLDMLAQRTPDYSLEQAFYNDQALFDIDMEGIFSQEWLFAGLICEIPKKGNYLTLDIGDNSIVIVRGDDNKIYAHHNTCRHRGSKICLEHRGKVAKLVCPYHQWTYNTDGQLIYAGQEMGSDFDKAKFSLKPVHCRTAGGYIYISLASVPPPIDEFLRDMEHYLEPYDLDNAKIAAESVMIEEANWKLVIENNRECYHCDASHPELLGSLLEWDDTHDPRASEGFKALVANKQLLWHEDKIPYEHKSAYENRNRIVRMPLKEGTHSMTMDGKVACKKLLGRIKSPDLGSMRILHLPNSWSHALGDHIIAFQVSPLGPQLTKVVTKWLVHKDAIAGVDYDPANLRKVWDATNDQDRVLGENNQLGINSQAYTPGPYSKTFEFGVINFIDWYAETLKNNLNN